MSVRQSAKQPVTNDSNAKTKNINNKYKTQERDLLAHHTFIGEEYYVVVYNNLWSYQPIINGK